MLHPEQQPAMQFANAAQTSYVCVMQLDFNCWTGADSNKNSLKVHEDSSSICLSSFQ